MMTEKITYYTTPDTIYSNDVDVVKGTSLTGKEVDKNFNTLEGRDIKSVAVSEDGKSIFFNLWNDTTLQCENLFDNAIQTIDADYDRINGILSYCINGDTENVRTIEGFVTPDMVHEMIETSAVFTDASLEGNGTIKNPLHLARMSKTGMYKPVINIVDELPDFANVGDRYVIDDEIDMNGSLYNYAGVKHIIKYLESTESDWHVARKVDWDDMLNAFEPEPVDRTHCSKHTPDWLGEFAGAYLAKPEYGFNVNYCGYATEEEDMHVVWGGKREIWWTATNERGRSAYVKRLDKGNDGVYQDIIDADQFYSVRLVRDMKPNETFGAEEIMGTNYQVVAMPSVKQGLRMWINVNFNSELLDITEDVEKHEEHRNKCNGTVTITDETETVVLVNGYDKDNRYKPEEWESTPVTYVCEYDGTKWIKQAINEGDSFLVTDLNGYYYYSKGSFIQPETYKTECSENCPIIAGLLERIANLESIVESMTKSEKPDLSELIDKALAYKYDDYDFVGSFTHAGNDMTYTPGTETLSDTMNDFARFFGALHRAGDVNTITFNGTDYVWTPELELKGSNFTSDGTLSGTLMRQLTSDFQANPEGVLAITVNGQEITAVIS